MLCTVAVPVIAAARGGQQAPPGALRMCIGPPGARPRCCVDPADAPTPRGETHPIHPECRGRYTHPEPVHPFPPDENSAGDDEEQQRESARRRGTSLRQGSSGAKAMSKKAGKKKLKKGLSKLKMIKAMAGADAGPAAGEEGAAAGEGDTGPSEAVPHSDSAAAAQSGSGDDGKSSDTLDDRSRQSVMMALFVDKTRLGLSAKDWKALQRTFGAATTKSEMRALVEELPDLSEQATFQIQCAIYNGARFGGLGSAVSIALKLKKKAAFARRLRASREVEEAAADAAASRRLLNIDAEGTKATSANNTGVQAVKPKARGRNNPSDDDGEKRDTDLKRDDLRRSALEAREWRRRNRPTRHALKPALAGVYLKTVNGWDALVAGLEKPRPPMPPAYCTVRKLQERWPPRSAAWAHLSGTSSAPASQRLAGQVRIPHMYASARTACFLNYCVSGWGAVYRSRSSRVVRPRLQSRWSRNRWRRRPRAPPPRPQARRSINNGVGP